MNVQLLAKTGYSNAMTPTRTARDTEYEVFARVTHRLRSAISATADYGRLVRALHDNRTLWTALAADVATLTNELPAPIRAQIFYLAEFVTLHTRDVMARKSSGEVLIDINTSIMRGLRNEGNAR